MRRRYLLLATALSTAMACGKKEPEPETKPPGNPKGSRYDAAVAPADDAWVSDPRHPDLENAAVLDADERAYVEALLAQLEQLGKRERIEGLDAYVARIKKLLEDGAKLTKEQLLDELAKAEELLGKAKKPSAQ